MQNTPTPDKARSNDIKHKLWVEEKLTLRAFAKQNNFNYRAVSDVVRGIRKGYYGECRVIAEKLGLI